MNIVLAPDSFKGSLTAIEATSIMKKAILSLNKEDTIIEKPMADGGEGTVDALLAATKGKKIPINCTGPLGKKIATYYCITPEQTAIIEVANIAGLTQVPNNKRNPNNTTTYGLGEVIIDALGRNCNTFIIGLGGSATNDGGLGMLLALGMKAFCKNGKEICKFGRDLLEIEQIDLSGLDPRLKHASIKVACDVENPLTGEKGASAVYGPQKGLTPSQITQYDHALSRFSRLMESITNSDGLYKTPGAGAAGGLGFSLLILGAKLLSGAKLIGEASHIHDAVQQADLVITGEGLSDEQTLYGKAPGYIADVAKQYHVPVVLISGGLKGDLNPLLEKFSACFSIANKPLTVEECMEQAETLLYSQIKQVVRLAHMIKGIH